MTTTDKEIYLLRNPVDNLDTDRTTDYKSFDEIKAVFKQMGFPCGRIGDKFVVLKPEGVLVYFIA